MKKKLLVPLLILAAFSSLARERWTPEQAGEWQRAKPWLAGCNFTASTAINQLEMWQAESFDPKTIERELGWAEELGFNSMRVYLHDIPFRQDPEGFLKRIGEFLAIAERHHIGTVFVFFDSCWGSHPKEGKQRDPAPGVHNSGWVQSPGLDILKDPARHDELKPFVASIITRFKDDKRVDAWDLFNEPDSTAGANEVPNKTALALQLLKKAFVWARECNPSQPLTSAVWNGNWSDVAKLTPMELTQLEESDVISFHNYSKLEELKKSVESLRRYQRPLLCTEYMARPMGSTFDPNLGYMKEQKIGAYNWGFVTGKTQTMYAWNSKLKEEPPVWFHDILRKDGSPFDKREVEYIRGLTKR